MTRPRDESQLVESALAGSPDAFQTIVETYHERLYAVVYRVLGDRSDAEEVMQETFLRAYRNLERFHQDSALYTWLYRIAVNAAVDRAKQRRRRRHHSLQDEELRLDSTLPHPGEGPAAGPEREELIGLVREGIHDLPEHYRAILLLREYGDKSYEELSAILEIPKGTVESRLFRARARLREWMLQRLGQDGLAGFAEPEE